MLVAIAWGLLGATDFPAVLFVVLALNNKPPTQILTPTAITTAVATKTTRSTHDGPSVT
jgi:hypothetical protein